MSGFAIDPEFTDLLALLPSGSFNDVQQARDGLDKMLAILNADLDLSGLTVEDRIVRGPCEVSKLDHAIDHGLTCSGSAPTGVRPALSPAAESRSVIWASRQVSFEGSKLFPTTAAQGRIASPRPMRERWPLRESGLDPHRSTAPQD